MPRHQAGGEDPGDQHRRLADRILRARDHQQWDCDGVSIARALIANNDLPKQWEAGHDLPAVPCTHCNKCLLNAPKNPLGCYEPDRFGGNYEAMVDEVFSVYRTHPNLVIPT